MYYSSAAIHHGLPRELVTSKALASSGRCRHRGKSGRWCSLMSPQQPRCAAVPRFGEVMGEVVQNSRFAQPRGFMRNVLAGACGLGTGRSGGDECTFGLTSPCSLFFWVQTEDL